MRLLVTAMASALLAGCMTVGPDYKAAPVEPVSLQGAADPAFSSAPPVASWWTQFDDPVLGQLVHDALGDNLDLQIAMARVRAARAAFTEQRLDQLPHITAGGSQDRRKQPDAALGGERVGSETYQLGFDAGWELDLFGRQRRAAEAARADLGAERDNLADAQVMVAAEVARNYFELRGAEQRLAVARANLDSQRDSLRIIQAMVSAGRGDEGDLASARAELETVQASVPPQETARRLALYRLAVLAGLRPVELGELDAATPQPPLAARLPIGDVGALLSRRPDIRAAERNMAAANADVGVATAELYPRIDLGGFLGFVALRGADFGSASSRAFSVASGVNWPAFHLPTALARKRAAQARSLGEVARYEQTVLQAVEELEGALTQYGQTQQRLGNLAQAAAHSARAAELARLRYREGGTPYLTVLDAQRTQLRAQDAVAQAETASYTSLVALYKALGGGWEAPSETETPRAQSPAPAPAG